METGSTGEHLDEKEEAILRLLLSVDFPGAEILRRQADVARVIGRCPCGCASIDLWIDPSQAEAAVGVPEPVPVEARSKKFLGGETTELLLFVQHGWLRGVEIIFYSDEPPPEFPPPESFELPVARFGNEDQR
jgi:hypothetical protein